MIITTPRLVACLTGPLRGRWFSVDDWADRTATGPENSTQDAYVAIGTVTHPVTGALATAMTYQERDHDRGH